MLVLSSYKLIVINLEIIYNRNPLSKPFTYINFDYCGRWQMETQNFDGLKTTSKETKFSESESYFSEKQNKQTWLLNVKQAFIVVTCGK